MKNETKQTPVKKRNTTPKHLKGIKLIQWPHTAPYKPDLKALLVSGDNVDFYIKTGVNIIEIFRIGNGQQTHVLTINRNRLERNHVLFETVDFPAKKVMLEFKSTDAITHLLANLPIYSDYETDYNNVHKARYYATGTLYQENATMYTELFKNL